MLKRTAMKNTTVAKIRFKWTNAHYFTHLHFHVYRGKQGRGKEIEDLHISCVLSNRDERHLWPRALEEAMSVLDDLAAFNQVHIVNLDEILEQKPTFKGVLANEDSC